MAAPRNQMQIIDDMIDLKIGHSDKHKVVIDFCIRYIFNLFLNILGKCQAVLCQGRNSHGAEFGNKNLQSSGNNFPENSHNHFWGCKSG